MSTVFQITTEGLFYSSLSRRVEIAEAIQLFSRLLKDRKKTATFNALNQGILANWSLEDDAVVPFGDKRSAWSISYTFDLDADILRILESSGGIELSLESFRHQSFVTIGDFTQFKVPLTPTLNPLAFPPPHWKPDNPVSLRTATFVTRILSDLNHEWRHFLRRPYPAIILQKIFRAVISIATLDFAVVEEASRWLHTSQTGKSGSGSFVEIYDLPPWESFQNNGTRPGRMTVVLDGNLEHALATVKRLLLGYKQERVQAGLRNVYLLFSGRDMASCRVDSHGKLEHTAPAPLLAGVNAPPLSAIKLLLQALAFAYPPLPPTWLRKLPVELQHRILEYVSEGPIEAARLGCLLKIGSPFAWVRTDKTRRGGNIERHWSLTHRSPTTPVDSYIWLAGTFCGLAYR